jgi:hypothetical protein
MDPKETKTFESAQSPNPNQTSSKTQKTQHIPGVSPVQPPSTNTQPESPPSFWAGLRKPMKWVVTIGVGALIFAFIGSKLFNFAQGLMKGKDTPKPISTTSTTDRSTIVSTPTISTDSKNECLDLPTRMAKANITADRVDRVFYQKYPDRSNKALGDTQLDRNLRQEWCAVANKLIR